MSPCNVRYCTSSMNEQSDIVARQLLDSCFLAEEDRTSDWILRKIQQIFFKFCQKSALQFTNFIHGVRFGLTRYPMGNGSFYLFLIWIISSSAIGKKNLNDSVAVSRAVATKCLTFESSTNQFFAIVQQKILKNKTFWIE